ncbi:alpha/beta hydrolase [Streptomyces olivaceoviridis]|uniref:alpha/beta fold hydrolase n=1 Tax=Streptomyces olivaceoviridis TaxID=1921 RepID=UPI00167AB431|nr:alpha/beta hydrolase [Streptomyces olivaceoviridis]GGZ25944.1 alpha/beta hydrolase [Streptomyces olivaceoviridis]
MSAYVADAAETRYVEGPSGERFAYRRFGRAGGRPLVMHMRLRGTIDHWDPAFLEPLAAGREVIVFDNRGVNLSTGNPPASMEDMVEGSLAFLHALGLTDIDVLGWSMGGIVAQGVALADPEIVRHLVVAGSSAGGVPDLPPPPARTRQTMSKPVNVAEDFLYLFFPETEEATAAGRASLERLEYRLKDSQAVVGPEAVRGQLGAIGSFKGFWHRQEELTLPVLVANGAHDVMIHAYASYAMSQKLPHAKVILYSDAGHGFLFQHPDDFAHEINRFLSA